jgi:hypothetical protein
MIVPCAAVLPERVVLLEYKAPENWIMAEDGKRRVNFTFG